MGASWCVWQGKHKGKVNSKKTFMKASFTQGRKTWETKTQSNEQLLACGAPCLKLVVGYVHYHII